MKTERWFVYAAVVVVLAFLMTGCSAKLKVSGPPCETDAGKTGKGVPCKTGKGVPFSIPKTYVADAKYTALKSGKKCKTRTFRKFVSLPTDGIYHVNIEPQIFSNSEFTIELNPNGTLKQIIFNADPELSETINSAAGLITAIAGHEATPATAVPGDDQTAGAAPKTFALDGPSLFSVISSETLQELRQKDPQIIQKLQMGDPEALQQLQRVDPEALWPSCDTGEYITCIQPFEIGQEIKKCQSS